MLLVGSVEAPTHYELMIWKAEEAGELQSTAFISIVQVDVGVECACAVLSVFVCFCMLYVAGALTKISFPNFAGSLLDNLLLQFLADNNPWTFFSAGWSAPFVVMPGSNHKIDSCSSVISLK
jgi:hypothetical protein